MKRKLKVLFVVLLTIATNSYAQREGGICISDSMSTAHESAMLHIVSTNKGLLLPKVSLEQRDNIKPLTLGLTVFVKDDGYQGFQFWSGEKWIGLEVINRTSLTNIAPLGGIIMYHGKLNNFNDKGKGIPGSEMEGWQLCNGENGAPNLSSKFIVGGGKETELSGKDANYNHIGYEQDVPDEFSITEDNIPAHSHSVSDEVTIEHKHTHNLSSHKSYNNADKEIDNSHTHPYATKSGGSRKKGEFSRKNHDNISSTNLSAELDLRNFVVGKKTAELEFKVDKNVIKEYSGVDLKFDNRPRYYTLAFIIRIDDYYEQEYEGLFEIKY